LAKKGSVGWGIRKERGRSSGRPAKILVCSQTTTIPSAIGRREEAEKERKFRSEDFSYEGEKPRADLSWVEKLIAWDI